MKTPRILRTSSFRLAALYAGLFVLSMGALFAIVYWLASDVLRDQARASVMSELRELTPTNPARSNDWLIAEISDRIATASQHGRYYGLQNQTGRIVAGDLPGPPTQMGWQELVAPNPSGARGAANASDDPEIVLLAFAHPLGDGRTLTVALDTFKISEAQEAIILAFAWAAAVGGMLALFGGVVLSRGFLKRVDGFNRAVENIIEGHMDERLGLSGAGDELDQLGGNFNEMLDRLQALMESLKQVSSDIAHDLRTPLSRLRQHLEAARGDARRMEDYETAVDQAVVDTDLILSTFSALLRITQIESGTRRSSFRSINLSAVYQNVAEVYAPVIDDAGKALAIDIMPDLEITGDHELLTQQLANLIENAITHTPPGTNVWLNLHQGAQGPIGLLGDNGPGIAETERHKIFERFHRLDVSRTTPGNGLGLALVKAVADLHGATITVTDNLPGTTFAIHFKQQAPEKTETV